MRVDGRRVTGANSMYYLVPHFMVHRYDAMNMITLDIPIDPMKKYIHAKRREGIPISHLALIIAGYLRCAAEYPFVNRFIGNKKIYAHTDFTVSMVVLRPDSDEDTMRKIHLDYTDDIFTVQEKLTAYIDENRDADQVNILDKVMGVIKKYRRCSASSAQFCASEINTDFSQSGW